MTNKSNNQSQDLKSRKEKLLQNLNYLSCNVPDYIVDELMDAIFDTVDKYFGDPLIDVIKQHPHRLLVMDIHKFDDTMTRIYDNDKYYNIVAYYLNDSSTFSKVVSFYSYIIADAIRRDMDEDVVQPTYRFLYIIRYMMSVYIKDKDAKCINMVYDTLMELTDNMRYIKMAISMIDDLCHGENTTEGIMNSYESIKEDMNYIETMFFLAFEM